MNDFFATLKQKAGPLPVWAWAAIGTVVLTVFLIFRKSHQATSSADSAQAAADQTNSNLGSAAELANMFEVAGLMPYQGGDVYVNTTQTNNPPPGETTTPPPPDTTPPPSGAPRTPPKVSGPPKVVAPAAPPKPQAIYKVVSGDNLTKIAKKYGVSEASLWAYNITKGVRPAATIATLKARGPNLLYSNESIYIPPKNWHP